MDHADFKLALLIENSSVCIDGNIASGIRRVFIASKDPNPSVNGTGIGLLSDAGFDVITKLCKEEADFSNRAFSKHRKPYITILQNNPFLTTRLPHGGKNPKQIFYGRFRTPRTKTYSDFSLVQVKRIPIGGVS